MLLDTYGPILRLAAQKMIENIALFEMYWVVNELVAGGISSTTMVFKVLSMGDTFLTARSEWFCSYIGKELG